MPTAEFIVNILAAIFFLGFWIFSFITLYHLTRFGIGTFPKKLAGVFLLGVIVIFSWSIVSFVGLDLASVQI